MYVPNNYLESWCDLEPTPGHVSLQQPIIRPLTIQDKLKSHFWCGLTKQIEGGESKVFTISLKKIGQLIV